MRRLLFSALAVAAFAVGGSPVMADDSAATDGTIAPAVVPMFDGMESGQIDAKIVMQNALKGRLILANTTDNDLQVALPVAFGAEHSVLAQFGGGGGGGFGGGGGGGGAGGGQTTGGGAGGGGLGGGGLGGGGGGGDGFFSIPAKKKITLNYNSVCLEHGKPEPRNKMDYVPVPLDDVAKSDTMKAFLMGVSLTGGSDKAMQAAGWHLAGMSWNELAAKMFDRAGVPDEPYFSRAELARARQIVAASRTKAAELKARSETGSLPRL